MSYMCVFWTRGGCGVNERFFWLFLLLFQVLNATNFRPKAGYKSTKKLQFGAHQFVPGRLLRCTGRSKPCAEVPDQNEDDNDDDGAHGAAHDLQRLRGSFGTGSRLRTAVRVRQRHCDNHWLRQRVVSRQVDDCVGRTSAQITKVGRPVVHDFCRIRITAAKQRDTRRRFDSEYVVRHIDMKFSVRVHIVDDQKLIAPA